MRQYSIEEKIIICEEYLSGKSSSSALCVKYGLSKGKPSGVFWRWISRYKKYGAAAFYRSEGNSTYLESFKEKVVKEYLSGSGSLVDICTKYNISSEETLNRWIQRYNANKELKDYNPKPEVYMANASRKTTLEERKEITEYCISHGKDYKGTAALYGVSYSQIYTWVKKYLTEGETGLSDRRGHHKADDEVDETERLRRENFRLKRQLEERDMAVELLKKVKEFEGM